MTSKPIHEGKTTVFISSDSGSTTDKADVFYNKEMELNRDITVAATLACAKRLHRFKSIPFSEIKYCDALSASGIRGLRIANELRIATTLNDWDLSAYKQIIKNCDQLKREMNLNVNIKVHNKNANVLLNEEKFNIVDLDPFGSPTTFLNSAAFSTLNYLEVTATDTAPLCGAHLKSGIRKYASVPLNNEYHSEMGIRVLIGQVVREFAKHDKAINPILSHATRHYYRVYLEVLPGAKNADKAIDELGYINHCNACGHRSFEYGLAVRNHKKCPSCGTVPKIAGPLWLGKLHESSFCSEVLESIDTLELNTKQKAKRLVELCKEELSNPTFYDQHIICKKLGISAQNMDILIDSLLKEGFQASRTHFTGTSFKTNAKMDQIKSIVHSLDGNT